jgi:restriction endonuclease Mrr
LLKWDTVVQEKMPKLWDVVAMGVSTVETYEIKRVDSDYFIEDVG